MKVLSASTIILTGFVVLAAPAQAQRSKPGGSGNDPCAQEADRLYSSIRDLETRMKTKREYIAKCRAGKQ